MKKSGKIISLLLSGALAAGCTGTTVYAENATEGSADTADLKKITLCLDWTPNTNHTGFYAADALGYYKDAGLAVEIVQPPENGAALMCASGQAQFAIDAQDTIAASWDSDEPLGITAVAALISHNTSGIMSRKGDGITSPKGLEGKTYSTWESPIELAMIKYVMEQDGGDFDKVTLIPNDITDEPAALAAHQTDAIWVFYGWGGINADIENVPIDYWNFGDLAPELDYYTPILVANNDFLESDPDTARAFMAATAKGYEYAEENPEDAADMLIAGDNTGSLEGAGDLVHASQKYLSSVYSDNNTPWGWIDPDRWNAFYGWLYNNKLITKDLTGYGFTDDFLPEESGNAAAQTAAENTTE